MSEDLTNVASVILAGGQGTRLFPITLNHSKPAVSFGGRYRLIDVPISNSIHSDIREMFIIAQYLSTELQHHISQTYHFDQFFPGMIDFLTPQERANGEKRWFEGTADAVRKNLDILLQAPVDYYLILSGDQLYNIDFKRMFRAALDTDADLTVAALPVAEKEAKRLGLLKIDEEKRVTGFVEKPEDPTVLNELKLPHTFFEQHKCNTRHPYLGSMGIYIFKRNALVSLLNEDLREDFGKHLIPGEINKGKSFAYIYNGYWEDIGTIRSFYDANLALTRSSPGLHTYDERKPIYARPTHLPGPKIRSAMIKDSIICEGSQIEAQEITNSVIGIRSRIHKGTVIRNTVMLGNHHYLSPTHRSKTLPIDYQIGENCLIEKAIIDEHVRIGNNVKLVNEKKLKTYDGDGIYVRDGIIVVTCGVSLSDGFVF